MRIECPKCRQRFNAADELMGKIVECGSCDKRFRVDDETVISERVRVYPGEKGAVDLTEFAAVPSQVGPLDGFGKAIQQKFEAPDPNLLHGKRQHMIPLLMSALIFSFVVILFLTTGGREGLLEGTTRQHHFIIVISAAIVGSLLLVLGMFRNRRFAVLLSIPFSAILLTLPIMFFNSDLRDISIDDIKPVEIEGANSISSSSNKPQDNYMAELGLTPLEEALEKYPESEVIAIYLRESTKLLRDKIYSSINDVTDQSNQGVLYDRGENGLLLLTDQKISLDEMVNVCGQFGEVVKVLPNLRLIDLKVIRKKMITQSSLAALNPSHRDFQQQNLIALRSIDTMERLGAIRRLGNAEPIAHRHDVVQALIKLLPTSNAEHQLAIIKTLKKWSEPGEGAESAVLEVSASLYEQDKVDVITMDFLLERNVDEGALLLMNLWEKDPVTWGESFIKLKDKAELLLLPKLSEMQEMPFASANTILRKTGTGEAIPVLESLLTEAGEKNAKTLKATIDEIKKRL